MPSPKPPPEREPEPPTGRAAALRTNLLPAAAIGVIMGFLAENEGSGLRVAAVVGVVGCGVVLGMLALKKAFRG